MEWITQFLGRLHPLLVHLPIGILILAFLFELLSRIKLYKKLKAAVPPSLFMGALFAVGSAVSGYFLSGEGGYDDELLERHRNFGIATAVFSVVVYILYTQSTSFFSDKVTRKKFYIVLFIPLMILLSFTGHFGGSITHGEDYLFDIVTTGHETSDPSIKLQAVVDVNNAVLYADVVQPILETRCYYCHSSRRQKGDLRLDDISHIQHGGEDGAIIEAGNADSSSLFKRLMLPLEDDDHMPPNEKPQPSSSEIAILQAWINDGASFTKKVSECSQREKIKTYFTAVVEQSKKQRLIPTEEVDEPDEKVIAELATKGIIVLPVAQQSNYVSASFVNKRVASRGDVQSLLPLKKQLVWLDLGRTTASDSIMELVSQLTGLRRLNAEYTPITNQGIKSLASLQDLRYLNLVGTKVNDEGLQSLSSLKHLENIFVYQTEVTGEGVRNYLAVSPKSVVDTGGYQLPKLVEETAPLKQSDK